MDHTNSISAAIDFIENHLYDDIAPSMVAAHSGFSEFHFHRIFQAMLGESVAGYIRKRRISEAAEQLKATDKAISELAVLAGFETHESFTRAFKKMFKVSPTDVRRHKDKPLAYFKRRMTAAMINHLKTGITLEPYYVVRESEQVVGMAGSFKQGDHIAIGKLWERFVPHSHEIPHAKPACAYGVCMPEHPQVKKGPDDVFVYMAGKPVSRADALPAGMVAVTLAKAKYAVFTHKGSLDSLLDTINYVWGTWVPQNVKQSIGPDFELYDERFDAETRSGEFDIYIPVEPA
jgi:AraC family transcriptional regulator